MPKKSVKATRRLAKRKVPKNTLCAEVPIDEPKIPPASTPLEEIFCTKRAKKSVLYKLLSSNDGENVQVSSEEEEEEEEPKEELSFREFLRQHNEQVAMAVPKIVFRCYYCTFKADAAIKVLMHRRRPHDTAIKEIRAREMSIYDDHNV